MGTIKISYHVPNQYTNLQHDVPGSNQYLSFINEFPFFKVNFDSYIENIYFPITNIFFPLETISNPFQIALFEYLSQDWKTFEEKLASFPQMDQNSQSPNFMNASYEDLLNTPVDEGSEEPNAISQQPISTQVQSQNRDLSSENPLETSSSTIDILYKHHLNNPLSFESSSSLLSSSNPFHVGNANYIVNTSQGGLQAPSSLTITVDPDEVFFSFTSANNHPLLFFTSHLRSDPIFLNGVSANPFGPFFLLSANDKPIILPNGNMTFVDNAGDFIFLITDPTPRASAFYFEVSDANGNVGVGTAYISAIQDQFYDAAVSYDSSNNILSFSATGNFLANDVAASNTTLSVLYIDITNSGNPLNDIYLPMDFSTAYIIGGEQGATTTLNINPDWSFTLTSIVNDINNPGSFPLPLTLSYVVEDSLGNTALASATFTPQITPIVLDFNDTGIHLISSEESTMTLGSLTGTNNQMHVGWIGESNAMLMYDPNGIGKLSSLNQISFVSYTKGAQTDLEGLNAFDTNHNHLLDIHDKDYQKFGILFPDGKFETLSQAGIVSISLASDHQSQNLNGNTVYGLSTYQTTDGHSHLAADVALDIKKSPTTTLLTLNDMIIDNDQLNLSSVDKSISSPPPTSVDVSQGSSSAVTIVGQMHAQDITSISEQLAQTTPQLAA